MVLPEHVVDFRAMVGNYIAWTDGEKWRFPSPDAVLFVSRRVTATVAVIDG